MRLRILTILWPSFLMAIVLDGLVFSAVDPAEVAFDRWAQSMSPLGFYTLGFLLFWSIIACASGMTALLLVEQDDSPPA